MSFTPKSSGGEYACKLNYFQMPNHSHSQYAMVEGYDGWDSFTPQKYTIVFKYGGEEYRTTTTTLKAARAFMNTSVSNEGGGESHNNISPYFTVYFWQRIA